MPDVRPHARPRAVPEAQTQTRPYKLALVLPDIHNPHEDKKAVAGVERYAADESWDYWICLGDLLDNDAISAFNAGKPRKLMAAPTVKEQFDYTNVFLDRHLQAVKAKSPNVECVLIEGNHEERTERYCDGRPELEGIVDVAEGLRLKERGIRYVRFWSKGESYKLGKLTCIHGAYTPQNHAAKHVRDYGTSLVYGHVHDAQQFSVKLKGSGKPLSAWSIGCLCRLDLDYMRGRPHNWIHAFAVVYIFPDGNFQLTTVPIVGGRFVGPTNGRVYNG